MPTVLPITKLGHPVLTKIAQKVTNVKDPVIQSLIDNMKETCGAKKGLGIAAPQVDQSLRLILMEPKPCLRYPDAPQMDAVVLINPTVLAVSEEIDEDWESCLSIPGFCGRVPRYKWVEVSYTNRDGEFVECRRFEGLEAIIFQHEEDHINGILFPDRTKPENYLTTEEYEERFVASSKCA